MEDSPHPQSNHLPKSPNLATMDLIGEDGPTSHPSALWDLSDLLDFTLDDHLIHTPVSDQRQFSLPLSQFDPPDLDPPGFVTDRVRKRDPRLTCTNFLEGRIPCACPEIDERIENEGLPGKKRVRTARVGLGFVARCQVSGCQADISALKGYHKRHRVCLGCANASSVLIGGDTQRYCQQCGKFHFLSDFDEGKRSCRRKLERHNNRRRRKPVDARGVTDKEHQGTFQNEASTINGDDGKDNACLSDQIADKEASLDFEDQCISILGSVPVTQSMNTEAAIPLVASGETKMDGGKDETKCELSSSYRDNKSAYSSVCPTGRISFKLYDWNPAEFPRRLRHQIFQWLASMPVELEGYIRPGCTILTAFIAMPENMWAKLCKDPVTYLDDFIVKPGKILSGRGSITVYLNNMIFRVIKGGTSVKKVDVKLQAPRLHFIYPTCFEAGKPIEFIVSGSNLLGPKFRFLVSFAEKYLPYDYSVASSHDQDGKESSCNHQLCRIHIRHSDTNLFGPAFVEVENESGLSNFIPLIIGDEAICSEMKLIEQKFDASLFQEGQQTAACDSLACSCKDFELRQTGFSGLLLDIAWSVKVPNSECTEQTVNCCQIRRYNRVLNYLLQSESTAILEKVLQNLEILVVKKGSFNFASSTCDSDLRLLQENMKLGSDLCKKLRKHGKSMMHSESDLIQINRGSRSTSQNDLTASIFTMNQDLETKASYKMGVQMASTSTCGGETDPLLNKEVIMNMNYVNGTCSPIYSATAQRSRPTIFLVATAVICVAVCVVLYHPFKARELAVSIRSRLVH